MTSDQQVWWVPWSGETLRQGQILPQCVIPDFSGTETLPIPSPTVSFDLHDVIVLTQTCDLVPQGSQPPRADVVALSPVFALDEFEHYNPWFRDPGRKNDLRLGRREGFYLLGSPVHGTDTSGCRIVDFHNIYSLPRTLLEAYAARYRPCLVLNPPCLEHFSQALGHFFMRVALPDQAAIPKLA